MPKVVKALNVKQLDAMIKSHVSEGIKHNVRKAVGGNPSGLLIQITPTGATSWIFRYTLNGKRRELGLGNYPTIPLSKAREEAAKMSMTVTLKGDPVEIRLEAAKQQQTFNQYAEKYISNRRSAWKNAKHAAQWQSTLEKWVFPKIGNQLIQSITMDMIVDILRQPVKSKNGKPLWAAHYETSRRIRMRIESIFRRAKAEKLFLGENPASLDLIGELLPELSKADKAVKHHAALPYSDAPAFMSELHKRDGIAAKALQFAIFTAARSGEVRNATWDEVDLENAIWTVPEHRMKAGKEHTVPLCDSALSILNEIPERKRSGLIFPGAKEGKPMSDMTLAAVLKRMGRTGITVHGFRSTFRDWAGETTAHPRDVIENALSHQLKDKAEAAYARGNQLEKRRMLMSEWCEYLTRN
jgi:integrase